MTLNIKQSAQLLADNRKYLNHILIKGMQNVDYKPVKVYFQEFLHHLGHYVNLIDINSISQPHQISKNIEMSLNCLKPGLISKSLDVVYLSGRVLSKIAYELTEKNLIANAWDWFVQPDGGLETCVMLLKKHDTAAEVVVSLLCNFSRFHLYELFSIYLKKLLDSEGAYINFICDLIEYLSRIKFFCDEFAGQVMANPNTTGGKNKNDKIIQLILNDQLVTIKKTWVNMIKEECHSLNINTRIQTTQFLGEMWSFFSIYFETDEESHDLIGIFKKLARDPNILVQYSSITQMFRLLLQFSKERNSIAPILYKSLVFIMIENQENVNLREFIINNFKHTFKLVLHIPVGILIEPFTKQVLYSNNTKYDFNFNDINFLLVISKHPRLVVTEAVMLLDILGKIYSEQPLIYKALKGVFLLILSRFMMNDLGVEFTFKYVKYNILAYCTLEKNNSVKIFSNAIRKNLNPEDYEYTEKGKIELDDPKTFNNNVTRNSILEIIYDILLIKNSKCSSITIKFQHY